MSFRNACYRGIKTPYKTGIACSQHCSVVLKFVWLSCSLSESSFMSINTCPCIEDKKAIEHCSNWYVCTKIDRNFNNFFMFFFFSFLFFSFLFFFPLVFDLFPGIWFLHTCQLFFWVIGHGCLPLH